KAYPGLVRKAGAQTRGVVYQQLNEHDLRRLDRYEGRQYKRVRVSVCLSDDNVVCSWCYVTRARYTNLLEREYWSLRDFVDNDLQTYLRRI
ncbi:gamma-glutamylcyclotransferase, partial [Thiogranum longum]